MLPGKGSVVGQRLVEHPDVRKIVFTGSTEVGKGVMAGCADRVKRVTLELGGKSANVVFADADLETAAATAPYAVFDNAGQDCCARSRILVQRSALRPVPGAARAGGAGRAGRGPGAGHRRDGPADQRGQRDRVASYVPDDAPVAFRGSAPDGPGFWFPPTVLAPVDPARRAVTRGDLRPGRRRRPVRRRGRRRPDRQRQRVRPVRLDLDPRRRPGAAGRPRHRGRQPVGQLALVGALLDAVRRLQAVRARPRARPGRPARVHREKNVFISTEG